MKARSITSVRILNPAYSAAAHRRALDAGEPYDQPREIEAAAGYVVDHRDAWILCCPGYMNADPQFEPADDECRAAVKQWMEEKRPSEIANIQNMLNNLKQFPEDQQKHIASLAKAYGLKPQAKPKA